MIVNGMARMLVMHKVAWGDHDYEKTWGSGSNQEDLKVSLEVKGVHQDTSTMQGWGRKVHMVVKLIRKCGECGGHVQKGSWKEGLWRKSTLEVIQPRKKYFYCALHSKHRVQGITEGYISGCVDRVELFTATRVAVCHLITAAHRQELTESRQRTPWL